MFHTSIANYKRKRRKKKGRAFTICTKLLGPSLCLLSHQVPLPEGLFEAYLVSGTKKKKKTSNFLLVILFEIFYRLINVSQKLLAQSTATQPLLI